MISSELRQDLVSGDWILMAPGRARYWRAHFKASPRKQESRGTCPFEQVFKKHKPILVYENKHGWELVVVENKNPVVSHGKVCAINSKYGFYARVGGVGHHDLVITRNHDNNFAHLSPPEANQVLEVFRDRYLMLSNDKCLAYVSIFHNWGRSAGASIYHPHYQILAIPVVPPDVEHSLAGSARYFKKQRKCVHCEMIKYEKKDKKRVIFENQGAIAVAPYFSREPFELRIFPKRHMPYFENTLDLDLGYVAEALRYSLKILERKLKDPDYNFFIHTAPLKNKRQYGHYHWHIEILPKLNISAGFELGTGIEINIIDPDEAAKILRA